MAPFRLPGSDSPAWGSIFHAIFSSPDAELTMEPKLVQPACFKDPHESYFAYFLNNPCLKYKINSIFLQSI